MNRPSLSPARTMRTLQIAALAVALIATAVSVSARLIYTPSYQELLDKSDLVVIATASASRDIDEKIDLPDISVTTADNRTVGFPVIGVETRFQVATVLKGKKTLKEFVLHHYREANAQLMRLNAPALVSFDPSKRTSFLLFLVRETDGRYAPTAGQTDPHLSSIHALGAFDR